MEQSWELAGVAEDCTSVILQPSTGEARSIHAGHSIRPLTAGCGSGRFTTPSTSERIDRMNCRGLVLPADSSERCSERWFIDPGTPLESALGSTYQCFKGDDFWMAVKLDHESNQLNIRASLLMPHSVRNTAVIFGPGLTFEDISPVRDKYLNYFIAFLGGAVAPV